MNTLHTSTPAANGLAFGATWIVHAPWAHPLWHTYAFFLYDLTTPLEGKREPVIYLPGATHEFMVWVLNPHEPVPEALPARLHTLQPANHGYQFIATSDAAAEERIASIVKLVELRQLSPDTDWRRDWDALFADGASLKK